MNVVQVMTELRPAGAERVVADLSLGLLERGHHVQVVSLLARPPESRILDELEAAHVPVHSLGVSRGAPWRGSRLQSLLASLRPELVHSHLFHPNLLTRLAPKNRTWALVNTVHVAERRRWRGWQFVLDRWSQHRSDAVTAVSVAVRNQLAERTRVAPETIPVIYNGIRAPRRLSSAEVAHMRSRWGVGDCTRVLGSVGRLHFQKGYDRLLALLPAMARFVPDGERWAVVVVGEGNERRALERLASLAPPAFKVVLPGFSSDGSECSAAFDVFLMPSRYEGFGLALAEAMAHGTPALVSSADSLPELAARCPAVRIVDFSPGAVSALVDGITELAAGPRSPSLPFPMAGMVDSYVELYERLLRATGIAT